MAMSKVPYTVDVNEYICTALEYIRKMDETRDYSGLMAVVERVQIHADKMEDAIHAAFDKRYSIQAWCEDGDLTDKEFREKVKEVMGK